MGFAEFARTKGIIPSVNAKHGAEAIEILNLMEATETLGDFVLRWAAVDQKDGDTVVTLLERLLKCYSEPSTHAKEIAKIGIEVRKLNR